MASVVVMTVFGAVLNATAFTGSMYLAKYLDGKNSKTDTERIRHDKAMEAYQQAMGEYEKRRRAYQDWLTEQYTDKKIAENTLNDTDQAFVLYKKAHPDTDFNLEPPQFKDYYQKSKKQKQYEMIYVAGGMLTTGYLASKFL